MALPGNLNSPLQGSKASIFSYNQFVSLSDGSVECQTGLEQQQVIIDSCQDSYVIHDLTISDSCQESYVIHDLNISDSCQDSDVIQDLTISDVIQDLAIKTRVKRN